MIKQMKGRGGSSSYIGRPPKSPKRLAFEYTAISFLHVLFAALLWKWDFDFLAFIFFAAASISACHGYTYFKQSRRDMVANP
jgi:hypothetical protein